MGIVLLPSVLVGVAVLLVVHSSRRGAGGDEESAHASALARRQILDTERRTEERYPASASATVRVLGGEDGGVDCRIVNVSRSGMRLEMAHAVALGAQLDVSWDSNFFVGTVCHSAPQHGRHVVGLQVISSNQR